MATDAKVLEPSAGDGALVKAFHNAYPTISVDCYELMPLNRQRLLRLGSITLHQEEDFLKAEIKDHYDIIIAII